MKWATSSIYAHGCRTSELSASGGGVSTIPTKMATARAQSVMQVQRVLSLLSPNLRMTTTAVNRCMMRTTAMTRASTSVSFLIPVGGKCCEAANSVVNLQRIWWKMLHRAIAVLKMTEQLVAIASQPRQTESLRGQRKLQPHATLE